MVGGTAASYGHGLNCNPADGVQVALCRNFGRIPVMYSPVQVTLDDRISNFSDLPSREIQQVLFDLSKTPKNQLPDFWSKLPQKFKNHKFICAAWTTRGSVEDNTFDRYLGTVEEMVAFWKRKKFCSQQATIFEALNTVDQTVAFSNFLIEKCMEATKLAGSTISRYKYALIKLLSFYCVPLRFDRERIKNVIKTCSQFWGKEAKPTAAIPRKILRQLFEYLRETDEHMFTFLAFVFFTAMRISEALKLSSRDFRFFTNSEGRPSVSLRLRHTKTKKRYSDSGHTITFTKLQVKTELDPFLLAQKLFAFAKASDDDTIVPFSGTFRRRAGKLYTWFRQMKNDFQLWNLDKNSVNYDTSAWRFHSLRTTFVGIMRKLGMSWEQLQLRTGHAWDSACTKDTYFMNALMSQEFDQDFERLLTQNSQAQELFVLTGSTKAELKQFRTSFESVLDDALQPHELFSLTGGVDEENLSSHDQQNFLQEENFEATFDNPFLSTVEQWSQSSTLRKTKRTNTKTGLSLSSKPIFAFVPKRVERKPASKPSFLSTPDLQRISLSSSPVTEGRAHPLAFSTDKKPTRDASTSLSFSCFPDNVFNTVEKQKQIVALEEMLPAKTYNPFFPSTTFTPVKNSVVLSRTPKLVYKNVQKHQQLSGSRKRKRSPSVAPFHSRKSEKCAPDLTKLLQQTKSRKKSTKKGETIYHPTRESIKRSENFRLSDFSPKRSRSRSFSPLCFSTTGKTTASSDKKPKTVKRFRN